MRLEMSKKTDLALQAIVHLEQSDGTSSGTEMAERIGTTIHFLPQILKPLVVAGWISSTPGPGGGYRLDAALSDVSVLDVVTEMEGDIGDQRCVLRGTPCPAVEQCALHTSWVRARSALLAELRATSLDAVLASAPKKGE
ncbi:MAG: RrF2 family transcriptional regulator [Acidimicrobiia bacterium]